MNTLILDCTLRDGGYVNKFDFGESNISYIVTKLAEANIDIIECGFLMSGKNDMNLSLYGSVEMVKKHIKNKRKGTMYVAMIAYGDISDNEISECDKEGIEGIRLTFHNHQVNEALILAKSLIKKGYKVFIQPVGTVSYTDSDLLDLIRKVNDINPYAFYIVDTMGTIYKNDLAHLFYLLNKNLNSEIKIGYHSHNNLQLAFSNAQYLIDFPYNRDVIIDSSVYGMGRGAGNLCTELLTQYLNDNNYSKHYNVITILEIFDKEINKIFRKNQWGYSMPYFIASTCQCHPNYAAYLINKQTLSMKDINTLLRSIPDKEKHLYNKKLIEKIYVDFQADHIDDRLSVDKLCRIIAGRTVLIIAPGASIDKNADVIRQYISEYDPFVISVNFISQKIECDAVFISNHKRIDNIYSDCNKLIIATSNLKKSIKSSNIVYVNYYDLISQYETENDNAGVMAIRLCTQLECGSIALAGYDGYDIYKQNNFTDEIKGDVYVDNSIIDQKNKSICRQLEQIKKTSELYFLTSSYYSDHDAVSD